MAQMDFKSKKREIKSRKNYFESDTFVNKTMIAMSPIMFANHLNRKDRR